MTCRQPDFDPNLLRRFEVEILNKDIRLVGVQVFCFTP